MNAFYATVVAKGHDAGHFMAEKSTAVDMCFEKQCAGACCLPVGMCSVVWRGDLRVRFGCVKCKHLQNKNASLCDSQFSVLSLCVLCRVLVPAVCAATLSRAHQCTVPSPHGLWRLACGTNKTQKLCDTQRSKQQAEGGEAPQGSLRGDGDMRPPYGHKYLNTAMAAA